MKRVTHPEFENLFQASASFIDVRSPCEFALGSIPGATNLPLLTDDERHQVGLAYKQQGQEAAIQLGHRLVCGGVKQARVDAWLSHLELDPTAFIYCFRGGLRSQITQAWLKERDRESVIVEGGYKALRNSLLRTIETLSPKLNFEVVSGLTGSGKTEYLKTCGRPYIDLEALAVHRGSAFGAMSERQPTQIDFENRLAIELLKCSREPGPILIEDESQRLGDRLVPAVLFAQMTASPRLTLEVPIETRVETILRDYVFDSKLSRAGDVSRFDDFRRSVRAISRKLGGLRATEILSDIDASEAEFKTSQTFESNRIWIRKLLDWYYDPLYNSSAPRR